ncbi:hypothetical protein BKA58DRAFT_436978 [Alternaria rosae]|uniref:uncharacterized protein n=1 Tax=Alternaria rosae TaxID=1187941 RepID=UPI001E8DA674|nr:uncharacterized protein BKA58DRAFT_436978 [Alternaria rosae]KAH6879290.1 hypothetical protein BKA58DRAFT_436978 [Alternaria rosae]
MAPSRFTTPQDLFYNQVYARPATHASSRTRIEDSQTPRDQARRNQISELNAANSPLLHLTAELRNTIYTYVFSYTACVFKGFNNDLIFDPNQPYLF